MADIKTIQMKGIILELTRGLRIEFTDRGRALRQVEEWAEKSTWWPVVIFGPEGCGKTAFLRQAASGLRELGFDVFYLHPLDRAYVAEVDDGLVRRTLEDGFWSRVAFGVFDLVRELLKRRGAAVVADDVFQAVGLNNVAAYVKGLLNAVEHPLHPYEKSWC